MQDSLGATAVWHCQQLLHVECTKQVGDFSSPVLSVHGVLTGTGTMSVCPYGSSSLLQEDAGRGVLAVICQPRMQKADDDDDARPT